jgi:hypothetical protein
MTSALRVLLGNTVQPIHIWTSMSLLIEYRCTHILQEHLFTMRLTIYPETTQCLDHFMYYTLLHIKCSIILEISCMARI